MPRAVEGREGASKVSDYPTRRGERQSGSHRAIGLGLAAHAGSTLVALPGSGSSRSLAAAAALGLVSHGPRAPTVCEKEREDRFLHAAMLGEKIQAPTPVQSSMRSE
jgi:hypothetical protein